MINQINATAALLYQPENAKKAVSKDQDKTAGEYDSAFTLDMSITAGTTGSKALSSDEISSLMDQADASTQALRDMVEKLIVKQQGGNATFTLNMQVLAASSSATADISQDPDWGVDAVSDKIVDFAKSLSGGDKSKIEMLRDAIDKGFASAKKTLGGKLPGVSMDTYDAVMAKLDDWAGETDNQSESTESSVAQ